MIEGYPYLETPISAFQRDFPQNVWDGIHIPWKEHTTQTFLKLHIGYEHDVDHEEGIKLTLEQPPAAEQKHPRVQSTSLGCCGQQKQ